MSTIDLKEIKFKELSAAVKALNESGCLEEKILTAGVSKEALVEKFLAAVEGIPDNDKGEWTGPEAAGDYYNRIVITEEGVGAIDEEPVVVAEEGVEVIDEESVEEEPEVIEETIEKKEKIIEENDKIIEKKEKKKKTSKMPSNKFNIYQIWKMNESISIEKLEEIAPSIKKTTIKAWIQAWKKNKNLPALS